jgi:hypothetical protein
VGAASCALLLVTAAGVAGDGDGSAGPVLDVGEGPIALVLGAWAVCGEIGFELGFGSSDWPGAGGGYGYSSRAEELPLPIPNGE